LFRRGVSVAELARNKAVDLRSFCSCWLSAEIEQPGLHFRRILCFEPLVRGNAPEVVGDIFRSLVPFTEGPARIARVAIPLVATGFQEYPASTMLPALVRAAVNWLSLGLSLECIKIVVPVSEDPADEERQCSAFRRIGDELAAPEGAARSRWRHDVFISYSHRNRDEIDFLATQLTTRRPGLRLFLDRLDLKPGNSWQQELFEAMDDCRRVLTVLSPPYLESKVCKEEFNIALLRHRESSEGVLIPLFLYSANLPTYMRLVQSIDGREGDREKLDRAAQQIVESF
jgi:hypothetical protein